MQKSLKKLRPKANKLKSFSANWKRANYELNMELGKQIEHLFDTESFPQPVALFFQIPTFKKVLKNLSKGSLWKDVYVFTDDDNHPPKEIQKIQNVANIFQKLCSISHFSNYPTNPLTKAKLLTENIHDYLSTINLLKSLKSKASLQIRDHLFSELVGFIQVLSKEVEKDEFHLSDIKNSPHLKKLKNLKLKTLKDKDVLHVHELLSLLHICNRDAMGESFLCHKLLNQIHKEVEYVFDSIAKNAPFFLPYALKKSIFKKIEENDNSSDLHDSLVALFNEPRYKIIETKQESHLQNIEDSCTNLKILLRSLDLMSESENLPERYTSYYSKGFQPVKMMLNQISSYNSQAGYFLSGFFETQTSYLLELLNNSSEKQPEVPLLDLDDKIINFLHVYAKIKPELLQKDIKELICNHDIKNLSHDLAKKKIEDTFSFLLPERNEKIFIDLSNDSRIILTDLLKMYKEMDSSSYLALLMKEKIKNLYLIDIPSFPLGWYIFGEISSVLFILSVQKNKDEPNPHNYIEEKLYQHPIFSILLKNKRF